MFKRGGLVWHNQHNAEYVNLPNWFLGQRPLNIKQKERYKLIIIES